MPIIAGLGWRPESYWLTVEGGNMSGPDEWLIVNVVGWGGGIILGLSEDDGTELIRGVDVRFADRSAPRSGQSVEVFGTPPLVDRLNAGTGAITLYLRIFGALDLLPLEDIVQSWLTQMGIRRHCRFSRLGSRPWQSRRGFRLPLRVAGLGEWSSKLERAVDQTWWADEARALGGLSVGMPRMAEESLDVLVTGREGLGVAARAMRPGGPAAGSRLLVVFDDDRSGAPVAMGDWLLGPGNSMLVIPESGRKSASVMTSLLEEITHDLPFDELAETLSTPDSRVLLVSDPEATNALRMSDAVVDVVRQAEALRRSAVTRLPEKLLDEVRETTRGDELVRTLGLGRDALSLVTPKAFEDLRYDAETRGFLPLSRIRRNLDLAERASRNVGDMLSEPGPVAEAVERVQARVVNLAVLRPGAGPDEAEAVEPDEPLVRGEAYLLQVDIGARAAASLIVNAPPFDELLPEIGEGGRHVLHVAIYSEDFIFGPPPAEGEPLKAAADTPPPMERLELPRIGPSTAVRFAVTPVTANPAAEARISIYYDLSPEQGQDDPGRYRNHLLQSFRITAALAEHANQRREGAIRAELDMSQTERFANLNALEPRLLALALNQGPGEATHRLTVKQGAHNGAALFTEHQMNARLNEARSLLKKVGVKGKGPRFPTVPQPNAAATGEFEAAIRDLAQAGAKLLAMLTGGRLQGEMLKMLGEVRKSADQILQITRLDPQYHFPWTLLYDVKLPERREAPVCTGYLRTTPDGTPLTCQACRDHCQLADPAEAYCPYGFWGLRHQVEQLVGGDKARNATSEVAPLREGGVYVAVDDQLSMLKALPGELERLLGREWLSIATPRDDLVSRMWEPEKRPAILLVASHCEMDGEAIAAPRMRLPGSDRWLKPGQLSQMLLEKEEGWSDPHALVLLAACESGAADLASVNDFVGTFLDVGAGAVVGTEAPVFEALAMRFARELTPAMVKGKRLGEALLDFRRALLRERNPLGLLFTAYGPAELATAKPALPVEVVA
jgi:hypothetical protein